MDGVIGEEIGGVAFFAERFFVLVPIKLFFSFVGEVVDSSIVVADEMGEAVGGGEIGFLGVAEVPFSDNASAVVAGLSEELREGVFFFWETVFGPRRNDGAHHAESKRPASGEGAGAGGRAHGTGSEVGEIDAAFYEAIEVGSFRGEAVVEAGVGVA